MFLKFILTIVVFSVLVLGGVWVFNDKMVVQNDVVAVGSSASLVEEAIDKGTCVAKTKRAGRKLLEPLYPNNTELSFETGAECNILPRLKQNSIVMYKSPRGPDPITLKVAGMPGDLISVGAENVLRINGSRFVNSKGRDYKLGASEQRKVMKKIADTHQGRIPAGQYFLMGDSDRIYLDSSRFGLAAGADILGVLAE